MWTSYMMTCEVCVCGPRDMMTCEVCVCGPRDMMTCEVCVCVDLVICDM